MAAVVPQNLLRWNGKTSHWGLPFINVKAVAQQALKIRLRRSNLVMLRLAGAKAVGHGSLIMCLVIPVC